MNDALSEKKQVMEQQEEALKIERQEKEEIQKLLQEMEQKVMTGEQLEAKEREAAKVYRKVQLQKKKLKQKE